VGEGNRRQIEGEITFGWNKSIRMSFTGGEITSNAGVMLLRDLDDALGLTDELAAALRDPRDPAYVAHPLVEILRSRLYMIALGHEDTNDATALRDDPALKLAIRGPGVEEFRDPLASQPTVSRLEHEILLPRGADGKLTPDAEHNLAVLEDTPLRWTERFMALHQLPSRLVLDLDSTDDEAHGSQEGAAYNGHFGFKAFHPLHAHLGDGLGELVKSRLRAGNVHTADGVVEFVEPLLPRLLSMAAEALWTRADCGFAKPAFFEQLEAADERAAKDGKRVRYAIKLRSNTTLAALAEPFLKRPVGRPPERVVEHFFDLEYRAQSWSKARRVVLLVKHVPGELFPETAFIVTNARPEEMSAEEVVLFYRRRADDSENRIKELKTDLAGGRTSCHSFESNRVRLALTACAYLLAHWCRSAGRRPAEPAAPGAPRPAHAAAPTIQMLRLLLLKIGARLLLHARRAYLLMASSCTSQALFFSVRERIRTLAEATARSLVRVPLNSVVRT
jgi:hypothetical protein